MHDLKGSYRPGYESYERGNSPLVTMGEDVNMTVPSIDWSEFDQLPLSECECRCGASWHSHGKAITVNGHLRVVSRIPCPSCGKNDEIRALRGAPEEYSISSKDIGELK